MRADIGNRIRQLREALGLDQRTAASESGISQSMWSRIESGDKQATLGQLIGIAGVLGCTTESLTEESPLRERLQVAMRMTRAPQGENERAALKTVQDRLVLMMEIDAHLRYIGVGVHHGKN